MDNKASKFNPGYLEQAIRLALAKGIGAEVRQIVIEHDVGCQSLYDGHKCTCDANVTICDRPS